MAGKKKGFYVQSPERTTTAQAENQTFVVTPQKWHERISIAEKGNNEWADDSGANRFIDEYKGKFDSVWFMARKKRIAVPPINEVFAYVQSDVSSTYNRDPYIAVNAKSGTTKAANLWEIILNYYWRELKTKAEIEKEIIDKDLVGYAWHKVGYATESIGAGDTLKITKEGLYSKRVAWRDVTWNLGSICPPDDCQWMAQRIVLPLEEIKKRYPAAAKLEGSVDPALMTDKKLVKNVTYKDDIKVGILREIWSKADKTIYLIADGLEDKYLENPRPWPDYLEEFPFLMYWDYAVPDSPRPMSAIAPWEMQLLEKMILLASAVNHTKRFSRQIIGKKGAIDPDSLDAFERGDDGAYIENNGSGDLNNNLKMVDFGQLPTDFYLLIDRLDAIKREIHGIPEFAMGGVTKTSTRTDGELDKINTGAIGRSNRRVDRLETHCENIARHMLAHYKANFDMEQTARITAVPPQAILDALKDHYDPVTRTIKFMPEDIQGEFDVEVKSGSTLPLDKENRDKILMTVLNTLGPVIDQVSANPVLFALIEQLLQDFDIKGLKEAFQMQVQQQQQAQAQDSKESSVKNVKDMADAQKRTAQAEQVQMETEIMARQEKSRTDLEHMVGIPVVGK